MSTPLKPMYAFARVDKLKTVADLAEAQLHADRDPSAKFEVRPGTNPDRDQVRWTRGAGDGVFDLVEGWRRAKGSARERAQAPICMHLILGVPASWVQITGGLHERDNPRNRKLLNAAKDFVEGQIGRVAAVRLDLDEMGGAVVDVFAVPVSERQRRLRKDGSRSDDGVLEISVNKAFEGLRSSTKERGDYSALQSAWTRFAQEQLDPTLVRGQRKYMTGRRHLETPEYRAQQQALADLQKRADAAQAVLDQLAAERKVLEDMRRSLDWRESGLARREEHYRSEIDQKVEALAATWTKCASGVALTDADQALMTAPMAVEASAALQEAMSKIEADKAAQEKREADNLREEERVAGLRVEAKKRAHELDERQLKIVSDEAAIQTRDAESRTRITKHDQWENRIRVAEEEASAARKLADNLAAEARSLLTNRIMAALHAIARRWRGKPLETDEELLSHPDMASLAAAAHEIRTDIDERWQSLETLKETVGLEVERMHLLSQKQSKDRDDLMDLKTELDRKDTEITQKASELDAREVKVTKRETTHTGAVAKHNECVAADLDRIKRFGPALRRHLIDVPAAGDQAILDDPMFTHISHQIREARKDLDAEITMKRATRDKLAAESNTLEQKSARIMAIGPALAAWLGGERSDELTAKLRQPEAKPFVDAYLGVMGALAERNKKVAETELELNAKIEEARKEEAKAAERRLAETEKRASDLENSIKANEAKAREIEKKLNRYGQFIDKLAALENHMPNSSQIAETIADANRQAQKAQRLRSTPMKGGFERD